MKRKILGIVTAALLVTGISAGKASATDAETFGTLAGAATGGFIGSHIGSGDGRLVATAAGVLIGAVLGNEIGRAHEHRHGTVYDPVYTGTDYDRRVYRPVYTAPRPAPKRKVVIHKRTVIVKHVAPHYDRHDHWDRKRWKKRMKKKRRWEKRRRELARTCYEHPRRCAQAF